jgi:membrane protease YdiL (CAAX protease family)
MTPSGLQARRFHAVLALLLLVPVPSLAVALALVEQPGPVGRALFVGAKLWILLLPLGWYLLMERGRPSWSPPRRGGLLVGAGLGVASAAAIAAAFWLLRSHIDPTALAATAELMGIATPPVYLAGAAYWVMVNSVLEEYVWRWFVYVQLERLVPPSAAVLGSALAFTAHHVVALQVYLPWGLTLLASSGVLIGGATWSWCYRRYRSIWPGWIAHALADIAVFAVGWMLIFG